jgi:16S rRNA (uracil1498-N3)-methyltransferase
MAERFYVKCALDIGSVVIEGPEAHHLSNVCRIRPGDQVYLFNGNGCQFRAEVMATSKRQVILEVLAMERPARELPFTLIVAAPLPKGDRATFLLEKLTELGVTAFIPLQTARSVVHPGETKLEKLQRTVIEASKQCGRNALLQVHALEEWQDFCKRLDLPATKLVAHPYEVGADGQVRISPSAKKQSAVVAVGPEGGFTDEEVRLAQAAGWIPKDLGPRILRVETAALAMAAKYIDF